MFIEKEDFKISIRLYELDQITENDDTLIESAINTSICEVKPYLGKYDIDTIFSQVGAARNSLLVRFCIDIAVFELVSIARPDQDLENRRALYKRAIDWLKLVKSGEVEVDLPKKEEQDTSGVHYGSASPKRNNYH